MDKCRFASSGTLELQNGILTNFLKENLEGSYLRGVSRAVTKRHPEEFPQEIMKDLVQQDTDTVTCGTYEIAARA